MPRMWPSTVLNDLVESIKTSDSKEIPRFDFILGKINKFSCSLFPSISCTCLNEFNTKFFHEFGRLGSKKRDFRISSYSSDKYLDSFQDVRKPMPDSITKSENMNSPGDYVIVVELVHIFPYKLVIFPQPESMNMNLRASSKYISLSTCLLQFIPCENLYCYGVDSVMLLVGKVNCYGLVAVIWEVL